MNKITNLAKQKSFVTTLTNQTFDDWVMKHELSLVAFYEEGEE